MPGRGGDYAADLGRILNWSPALVISMTPEEEMRAAGAADLSRDLANSGIAWRHMPVADFGVPTAPALWPPIEALARAALDAGNRVLIHCMGGCGRSGMAALRVMVAAGEPAEPALARLRSVRLCAVETVDQRRWASSPPDLLSTPGQA